MPKELNYDFTYQYKGDKPHAPTQVGNWTYQYDSNGNITKAERVLNSDSKDKTKTNKGGSKKDKDVEGQRTVKRGKHGETVYVSKFFEVRNGQQITKHIFVGDKRVVSKMSHKKEKRDFSSYELKQTYYYHPDHLGSTNFVTDAEGNEYQHLEYMPYGETWINEVSNKNIIDYKFTGKEYDPRTGLYYFGARYLDPQLSMWISTDPAIEDYMPERPVNKKAKKRNQSLPGQGGVFNPVNLALYHYSSNNPIKYKDPDGESTIINENGLVQEVINDGDLSIYQHSEDGKVKVGETLFWDAFRSPDTKRAVGKVYVGKSIDDYMRSKVKKAKKYGRIKTFMKTIPGGEFDIKTQYPGHEGKSYHGFLFKGKYITLREAGNILAGMNAAQFDMKFENFQKGAGALHEGGLTGLFMYKAFGKTYGNKPMYGEVGYQYHRSKYGYKLYKTENKLE